jgi:hypothetical protein
LDLLIYQSILFWWLVSNNAEKLIEGASASPLPYINIL